MMSDRVLFEILIAIDGAGSTFLLISYIVLTSWTKDVTGWLVAGLFFIITTMLGLGLVSMYFGSWYLQRESYVAGYVLLGATLWGTSVPIWLAWWKRRRESRGITERGKRKGG